MMNHLILSKACLSLSAEERVEHTKDAKSTSTHRPAFLSITTSFVFIHSDDLSHFRKQSSDIYFVITVQCGL